MKEQKIIPLTQIDIPFPVIKTITGVLLENGRQVSFHVKTVESFFYVGKINLYIPSLKKNLSISGVCFFSWDSELQQDVWKFKPNINGKNNHFYYEAMKQNSSFKKKFYKTNGSCSQCEYLGSAKAGDKNIDVYKCKEYGKSGIDVVICRYGDLPHEYFGTHLNLLERYNNETENPMLAFEKAKEIYNQTKIVKQKE